MSHLVNYIGCFVSPEELMEKLSGIREDGLENTIKTPHVTFAYRPEAVDRNLFGEKVGITIIGYGNDGTNEGLKYTGKNIFTVQYHPEACPGPQDSGYLFDRFMKMMEV